MTLADTTPRFGVAPWPSRQDFFRQMADEERTVQVAWTLRFQEGGFSCPRCQHEQYRAFKSEPEIRECCACRYRVRLRVGTPFENSKLPLTTWLKAAFLILSWRRGISAKKLQREMSFTSYATAYRVCGVLRRALE